MTRLAVACVAAAACWTTPRPPSEPAPAGTTWVTPRLDWRATQPPTAIAVESAKTALLGGAFGWLGRIDLATGKLLVERHIGALSIDDILLLPQGRALVVGTREDAANERRTEAILVELATFVTRTIRLSSQSDRGYHSAAAALLADGTVAISGPGIPLATYDPRSWEVVRVLDEEHGWSGVRASATALVAYRSASVYQFDLKTGERRSIGIGTQLAASKAIVGMRRYHDGSWYIDLVESDGKKRSLPMAIDLFTIDREGRWLVAVVKRSLHVYTLPDAKLWKRFDLGRQTHGVSRLDVAGDTVVLTSSSVVRRIQLATGEVSPLGPPPYSTTSHLAVDNAGAVLAIGSEVWRVVDAAIVGSAPLEGATPMVPPPGETRRFAAIDDSVRERPIVTLRAFSDGHQAALVRRWTLEQDTATGWLAASGDVAIELLATDTSPARLVRSDGARLQHLTELHADANVRDVDLDAGVAAVEVKGDVVVARLAGTVTTKQRLRAPRCAEWADALLERGSDRALTFDERDLIVWNRNTGRALGAVQLDETPHFVTFVPAREELLIVLDRGLALWSPRANELRTYRELAPYDVAVSPDGQRVALGLGDGRIVLAPYEAIRAKTKLTRGRVIKAPSKCEDIDPFDARDPDEDEWEEEPPDDPCGGADPCAP